MPFGREQFIIEKEINGETIEKIYAKKLIPTPIEEFEQLPEEEKMLHKPYPFSQRTYEVMPGVICEQDVAVEMRDGTRLYCDIFRPVDEWRGNACNLLAFILFRAFIQVGVPECHPLRNGTGSGDLSHGNKANLLE